VDVYQYLEPLLNDYRKIRHATPAGKHELQHVVGAPVHVDSPWPQLKGAWFQPLRLWI
jgi:hypothetical protein